MRAVIAVGAVVLGMVAAPVAQADEDSFVQHVRAIGFTTTSGDDSGLITAGMGVCSLAGEGLSRDSMNQAAEDTLSDRGYSVAQADQFVGYSLTDLCPNTHVAVTDRQPRILG